MRKYDEAEERYIALIIRWLKDIYLSGDERYERTFDYTERQVERLWKEARIRYEKEKKNEASISN